MQGYHVILSEVHQIASRNQRPGMPQPLKVVSFLPDGSVRILYPYDTPKPPPFVHRLFPSQNHFCSVDSRQGREASCDTNLSTNIGPGSRCSQDADRERRDKGEVLRLHSCFLLDLKRWYYRIGTLPAPSARSFYQPALHSIPLHISTPSVTLPRQQPSEAQKAVPYLGQC